jgi:hypothetical protein
MIAEILKDIPQGGHLVKLGANCPAALLIVGSRPDIKFLSIDDGDSTMPHEMQQFVEFKMDVTNFDCRVGADGLISAKLYSAGPIDLLFLDSNFTITGIKTRLEAWMRFLGKPSWLIMHDWVRYPKVKEATSQVITRQPDKTSEMSGAWRFQ